MLQVDEIRHSYDETVTLDGVSVQLGKGQTGCILGPSGCGKTTLLRCIAGFENVSGGTIALHGRICSSVDVHVPPESRRIGMVLYARLQTLSLEYSGARTLPGKYIPAPRVLSRKLYSDGSRRRP